MLCGNAHRTLHCRRSANLLHLREARRCLELRKALGTSLQKKRLGLSLTLRQVATLLGDGVNKESVRQWERNIYYPTKRYRARIVEFLGFDPESPNPTGEG